MSSRRTALWIGSALGLIAIVAWVAEIDIVFQESAEEQEPNRKSLVIDGASSGQKADVQ
ncbi:putative conserved membrane protein [Synechococcus sp. BIOS-E4-1]|nr:putative conserved membrane protein [Synechococcus sp. BIOS-E4-1]